MAYTYKRFKNEKWEAMATFFKAFKWIKPDDSENLTKIAKHDIMKSMCSI